MSDKKYIAGSCKQITTQYWEIMNLSLKLSDMQSISNEKWYVNMTVMQRKEVGKYGDTHYVVENDYKQKQKESQEISKDIGKEWTDSKVNIEDVTF